MITAKQIIEAYHSIVKVGKKHASTFINPSKSELLKEFRGREIRFFAIPKSKDIYVWDAELATHDDLQDDLIPHISIDDVIAGQAEKSGDKYESYTAANVASVLDEPEDNKELLKYFLDDLLNQDWSWTEKYSISMKKLVKGLREDIEDALSNASESLISLSLAGVAPMKKIADKVFNHHIKMRKDTRGKVFKKPARTPGGEAKEALDVSNGDFDKAHELLTHLKTMAKEQNIPDMYDQYKKGLSHLKRMRQAKQ